MKLPIYYKIDLTTNVIEPYKIKKDDFMKYIGGKTLAAKLLMDFTEPGLDPLSPEAYIIVNTSPLTGTGAPVTSRFNTTFKNVLTGGIASSNCGGPFGYMLKRAGVDGLIITGKAEKPVTISIVDGKAKIISAEHLWGLDAEKTQEELPEKYGKFVIGPAGENLVRFACTVSGERVAGRCGSGAVFGSKNLKAMIAYGTKETEVYDKEKFDAYVEKWVKFLQGHPLTGEGLPAYGSAGLVSKAQVSGVLPTRNFQSGKFDGFEKISGEELAENNMIRNGSCISCPIRCERRVEVNKKEVKGPEYETVSLLGSNLGVANLKLTNDINYYADIWGMDSISLGGVIAFAMELKEKGMADFDVEFGKEENIIETIRKITYREGDFYDLGEGTKRLSEKYGGKEFAIHSKGLELAAYEPRSSVGMGLGYATSNRGGCHLNGGYLALLESIGVLNMDGHTPKGKPELTVFLQNSVEAVSTLGFCLFSLQSMIPSFLFKTGPTSKVNTFVPKVAIASRGVVGSVVKSSSKILKVKSMFLIPHCRAVELATGIKMDTAKFMMLGERGFNLERLYNIREGLTKDDDSLPDRLTKVPQIKGNPESVVNLEVMLPIYYKCRNWDENGVPTEKIKERLGI
ncbi:MAG: aldehyde ferredoxin oxidoreductase family protein [Lachnospirales bacterium]